MQRISLRPGGEWPAKNGVHSTFWMSYELPVLKEAFRQRHKINSKLYLIDFRISHVFIWEFIYWNSVIISRYSA